LLAFEFANCKDIKFTA